MDPRDMTTALGMQPDRLWRAGEPRIGYKGQARDGVNAESYWTCPMEKGAWPPTTLASATEAALGRLSSKRGFLRQIRSEGGGAEFFIGWFFEGQGGDMLPAALLAKAAELEIDLSPDVYPQ